MIFIGGYTGTSGVETWTDCTGTHSVVWGCTHSGVFKEEIKPQKKNPYLLSLLYYLIPLKIGLIQKKKESFKKASQVVISKVGVIDE